MTIRKRNSPGIEINEIDRSQYNNKPDYSTVGTTTFICGFADKGTDYKTEWINSIKTLTDTYGQPTNEVERYFYNAAVEILNNGGVLLTTKLPYTNTSKDRFATTTYTVNTNISQLQDTEEFDYYIDKLQHVDSTLTSYIEIISNTETDNLITLEQFDNYKTQNAIIPNNEIKIVDITRRKYEKIDMLTVKNNDQTNFINVSEEFIGIMPVIVSPVNAMYFQQLIQDTTKINTIESSLSGQEISENISAFNVINNAINRDNKQLQTYLIPETYNSNFELMLSAQSINDASVSKIAASYFPNINYLTETFLNRQYLKQIGVVVFQVFKDEANNKKLNFTPVESFIGSLTKNNEFSENNQISFIDDVVNNNSKYINLFSNVPTTANYKNASTILIKNQMSKILGFKSSESVKNIDYIESIVNPLTRIFDINQDPNLVNIDVVCDAGVSNIAQYVKNYGSLTNEQIINPDTIDKFNANVYPKIWIDNYNNRQLWKIEDGYAAWKAILLKYDDFCKNVRKDCIFLADGLRPFCLEGNEKLVRTTKMSNTIENSIIPNLKYMSGINSSYSAGYCNWFYIQDYFSDVYFWLPPSIKAAGICTYIDTYFHSWDAPAGTIRGTLRNVIDVAFSPRNDEAGKIYQQAWNYAINYPIDGIVIEGQKTFQIEKTALDRINVRRLMIYLEKHVKNIARHFVYEGNTEYTRQRFVDTIRPIFENAKNSYGINDYAIRCDNTNNTTTTIENNELRCAIAVKPVKTIEWIICDFIVTNQSANVYEEVLKN